MSILLILLGILMVVYVAIGQNNKKLYCVIACILLTLGAALRSFKVGPDGAVYADYFKTLQTMEFSKIPLVFTKEPTFYYVTKVLQNVGLDLQGWYAIIGGLFAFSVMLIIYLYSEMPNYSIMVLFSLGYYVFSFTGLRQTVALAIVILSCIFLRKKKYIVCIALVMLASLFHNSALIFLLILPFQFIHFSRKHYVIGICLGGISVIFFKGQMYNLIYSIIEETERFEVYKGYSYGLTWMGYFIQLAIFIFCLFCIEEKQFRDNKLFFDLSFWGVYFQLFSTLMAEMFRISMYFNIFNIILIANTCRYNKFTKDSKKIALFFVTGMLLYYFFHSHTGYNYIFYWS